jgi:transketolase
LDAHSLPEPLATSCVDALRFLAVDAIEKAKSGHPGLPLGAAEFAFATWQQELRFDPDAPGWINRDRFVLSAGHGSTLLYGLLHLYGFDLPLAELQRFRQWGSKTPGHPENTLTSGVEVTTGPLGQGFAHGVGLALASKHLGARFNTPEHCIVDARVFGLVSDGDLMEGVAAEAASLAGHLRLDNLVYLYDSNRITIDGSTDIAFTESVADRFQSYGWKVLHVDGHDGKAVRTALFDARGSDRPVLVICDTTIGFGAPTKAGTSKVHGSPLGAEEAAKTREARGWTHGAFEVPDDVRAVFRTRSDEGRRRHAAWRGTFAAWRTANPAKAAEWDELFGPLPVDLEAQLVAAAGESGAATRALGGKVINRAAELVPGLLGGSADLDESTSTFLKGLGVAHAGHFAGRNIHWGIREHAMAAAANGLSLFGGLRAFCATFLVFSDYARPSIRLAALQHAPTVFVFTHDSVFLGEDGPTHQPIEQLASLRLIPNLEVWRPADARETALAWAGALRRTDGPSLLSLTRQKLAPLSGRAAQVPSNADEAAAYVVHEPEGALDAVLIATGSEVPLAIEAARKLESDGRRVRVVSMPCVERFVRRKADAQYRLLPRGVPVATLEAGRTELWRRFAGLDGLCLGIDSFGHSAPAEVIAEKLGFTPGDVAARVSDWLAAAR